MLCQPENFTLKLSSPRQSQLFELEFSGNSPEFRGFDSLEEKIPRKGVPRVKKKSQKVIAVKSRQMTVWTRFNSF
jgi:hypothetical protein